MDGFIEILEIIWDVCLICLAIIYGLGILSGTFTFALEEPAGWLLLIGMIAFGVWDIARVRRKRRRRSEDDDRPERVPGA